MGNTRKASKTVFTIFTVVLSLSVLLNVLRLVSSVNYYNQCQPQYVAVSQIDYDEANYLHIGALKNPVDETSKEAKEALKAAKKELKLSDWYKERVLESVKFVAMSGISTILAVASLIVGIATYVNTHFQTKKSKIVISVLAIIAIATVIYVVYPIPAIDYIQKFSNPLIPYVVPVE